MKRIFDLLQICGFRPVLYSSATKLIISLSAVLIWDRFIVAESAVSPGLVDTGFFFLAVWFILWAWLQYLALDGVRPLSIFYRDKEKTSGSRKSFFMTDFIGYEGNPFEGLEEDEATAAKLASDLLVALIYLVPSLIASML